MCCETDRIAPLRGGEIGSSFGLAMQIDLILEPDRTPAQIAELGRMAEDYGVRTSYHLRPFMTSDEIALRLHDEPADAIRLIGEYVMPAFR